MGFGIVHNILLTREFAGDKRLFWKCCSMEVNGTNPLLLSPKMWVQNSQNYGRWITFTVFTVSGQNISQCPNRVVGRA